MLTSSHSKNRLTEEEKLIFEKQGYLEIPEVLSQGEVQSIERLVDGAYNKHLLSGKDPYRGKKINPKHPFFYPDLLGISGDFIDLLDHPKTFPKVCGIWAGTSIATIRTSS